jgi:hypothetical protein
LRLHSALLGLKGFSFHKRVNLYRYVAGVSAALDKLRREMEAKEGRCKLNAVDP